jgi:hypothetical protein
MKALTVRQIHNRVIFFLLIIAALAGIGLLAEIAQIRVDQETQESGY